MNNIDHEHPAIKTLVEQDAKKMLDDFERAAMAYERLGKLTKDDEKTREIRKSAIADLARARSALIATLPATPPDLLRDALEALKPFAEKEWLVKPSYHDDYRLKTIIHVKHFRAAAAILDRARKAGVL